ncbi:nucleotidyltransferase family protein [bacterium]|nr:nucleotidyltransferase family protein [bacterium]
MPLIPRPKGPDPTTLALLRACLLSGKPCREGLETWVQSGIEVDRDYPYLVRLRQNLVRQGWNHLVPTEANSAAESIFLQNTSIISSVMPALKALGEADVPFLLLKGVAFGLQYYPDLATRPFEDIDILVPVSARLRVFDLLAKVGFSPVHNSWQTERKRPHWVRHAVSLAGPSRVSLDLHWHALHECKGETVDEPYFEEKIPIQLLDCKAFTLCHNHALFHLLAHACIWHPPFNRWRWVLDAAALVQSNRIDWPLLQQTAQRFRMQAQLNWSLCLLREFVPEIPPQFIDNLDGECTWMDRLNLWVRSRQPGEMLRRVFYPWMDYWRLLMYEQSRTSPFEFLWARFNGPFSGAAQSGDRDPQG